MRARFVGIGYIDLFIAIVAADNVILMLNDGSYNYQLFKSNRNEFSSNFQLKKLYMRNPVARNLLAGHCFYVKHSETEIHTFLIHNL